MDDEATRRRDALIEDVWRNHRRRVLDVGYRMLGSVTEAEDVASEAYARLVDADVAAIEDPVGWLVTVTGRLCVDQLRSAEHRRRAYVGPWLPEPLLADRLGDPAEQVTLDDSVRMALMVLLDRLSPAERTSLVLHDFFGIPFGEVADIVGRTPAACRQLASRARRRIQSDPESPRTSTSRRELEEVAQRFAEACGAGAIGPLIEVLDPHATGDFDSGGVVPHAPLRAISGAVDIARVLLHAFVDRGLTFSVEEVNGDPGVVARERDRLVAVIALGVTDGRIDLLHGIGSPSKLRHLGPPPGDPDGGP